jgi:hypothetical protein
MRFDFAVALVRWFDEAGRIGKASSHSLSAVCWSAKPPAPSSGCRALRTSQLEVVPFRRKSVGATYSCRKLQLGEPISSASSFAFPPASMTTALTCAH